MRTHAAAINRTHSALLGRAKTAGAPHHDPVWPPGTSVAGQLIGDPALVVRTGDLPHFGPRTSSAPCHPDERVRPRDRPRA